ncbi:hypothetical protein FJC99_15280 [Escherichia coli]|nr:hypothetical protein [Escherichia coli]
MNILIEINMVLFLWPNLLMEKPHNLPAASCSWNSDRPESWQNKQGITERLSPQYSTARSSICSIKVGSHVDLCCRGIFYFFSSVPSVMCRFRR